MTYPGRGSPVPGATIPRVGSRRWGDQRETHIHAGVDVLGAPGTPVLAPEASTVVAVATASRPPWTGYAPCVFLRGESGRYHLLAHLSGAPLTLRVGAFVPLGGVVGYIGRPERHTHWEVRTREHRRRDEPAIDASLSPADWLDGVDVPFGLDLQPAPELPATQSQQLPQLQPAAPPAAVNRSQGSNGAALAFLVGFAWLMMTRTR